MATLAEESIALAVRCLKDRKKKFAQQVFEGEEAINILDNEIDNLGMKLLALRQPMASDLRFITSAMRMHIFLSVISGLNHPSLSNRFEEDT
jgi:phosphate transport system protein